MSSDDYTHILAKPHSMIIDGKRQIMPAGTPCSPTQRQVLNMPDVFMPKDGGSDSPAVETGYNLREHSNSKVKELVDTINDPLLLDRMLVEEEQGRNRVGAKEAIQARIEELTDSAGGAE